MIIKRMHLLKTGRKTILYICITALIIIIITPVFFLFSLSLLSSHEAYQYPLPIWPAFALDFKLEQGKRGYLLSIYEKRDEEYQTLIDTGDSEKIVRYMRTNLSIEMTEEEIDGYLTEVDDKEVIYFKRSKNLLHNYVTFFNITRDSIPALIRSIQVAGMTILISLSIGGMAGYAFARYIFRGKNTLKVGVLFVRVFPAVAIAMPMVIILAYLGMYDKPLGLSLVYSVGSIALTIWITASIFMGIPVELEEAARVFGASRLRTFFSITLPLALPGLAACSMYAFIGAWNETVSALILTQFKPTFAVVIYQSLLGAEGQVNLTAAGGIIMAMPAVLFTFFIRKYIKQMWSGSSI